MKIPQQVRTILIAAALVTAAGSRSAQSAPVQHGHSAQAKTYRNVRGQVITINATGRAGEPASAIIDHENIPNFMRAMRMSMPFKNAKDAKKLRRGDKIRFDMVLQKGSFLVANVRKLPPATRLNLAQMGH